mmetsp:Transcript_17180/g.40340  ORF Transcript_17180/g.40340 Transcript_17180/m.40340 type:complete len:340 (-) Transcript_17180:188-1207(-)
MRRRLVELPVSIAGNVVLHEQSFRLLLNSLSDLRVVVADEGVVLVLVGLRILAHDDDPRARVALADGPDSLEEAMHCDRRDLLCVLLHTSKALVVRGPVLVVVEPRCDEGDVAPARVLGNVRDEERVLGKDTTRPMLALHAEVADVAEPVGSTALPPLKGEVPAAPANPSETARLQVLEVLGVVADWHNPRVDLWGPVGRDCWKLVTQPPQGKMELVDPRHPHEAAGADGVEPQGVTNLQVAVLLLNDLRCAQERSLGLAEAPQCCLAAHLGTGPLQSHLHIVALRGVTEKRHAVLAQRSEPEPSAALEQVAIPPALVSSRAAIVAVDHPADICYAPRL